MAYKSLTQFIDTLEKADELIRIKEFVNPELEITEITDRVSKIPGGGKALLFENTGTDFPILINAYGSDKRMGLALGVENLDDIANEIEALFKKLSSPKKNIIEKLKLLPELGRVAAYMPKVVSGRGKSQEVIDKNPDLSKIPVLKCWPADGGKFITLPMVITKDPHTKIRNVGMYRLQVFDKNLTGMHWHKHKVGARHFEEYKKLGEKMPVAVAIGGDPAYAYSATAPIPDNMDEFMLAGFLRKQKVKLVKAISQDIEVPADADIIIEGYVDPQEAFILEGPFGDHTGFYSLADYYPKFHVTCITHKKNAVYPATIVGIPPQEDAYIGKATERIFIAPMRMTLVPELTDMNLPSYGVAHNLTIVSIKKTFAGQAIKVMNALWGAGQMMFNKVLIVVDDEVDVHDYQAVYQAFVKHADPIGDFHFSVGPLDVLDHSSSKYAYGSKLCIDATKKLPEEINTIFNDNKKHEPNLEVLEILKNKHSEINDAFFVGSSNENSILFVSFKKSKALHVKELAKAFSLVNELAELKTIIFFDKEVNIHDLPMTAWLVTGNIEPKRDCFFIENGTHSFAAIDGTRKTAANDKFKRDWPNILVSDEKTIKSIDQKWDSFNLGAFVKSPSEYYRPLIINEGAVVKGG